MQRSLRMLMPFSQDERGMALPLTLMVLVVLGAVSAALLTVGSSEIQIAANNLRGTQALFVAEGGVERAIGQFVANPDLVTNATTDTVTLFQGQALVAIGTYTVTYRSIGFATVLVVSTGQTTVGSGQRTVETIVTTHAIAKQALLGDRGIKVKKTSNVKGECGSVHDNTKTEIKCEGVSGVCIERAATSSTENCKNCTDEDRVGDVAGSGGGKSKVKMAKVSPLDFKAKADYVLGDDGFVRDKNGNVLNEGVDGKGKKTGKATAWNGWEMGGKGEWVSDNDSPPNGTYYASKRIRIVGSPGSPGSPWKVTLVAGGDKDKGTVSIRGDAVMEPAASGLPLIVAGKIRVKWEKADEDAQDDDDKADDTKAKADDDADDKKNDDDEAADDSDDDKKEKDRKRPRNYVDLKGTIIATSHKDKDKDKGKGRVKLSGDVRLTGNVIAQGRIEVKGSTVTYDCANPPRITGPLQIISWSTSTQ